MRKEPQGAQWCPSRNCVTVTFFAYAACVGVIPVFYGYGWGKGRGGWGERGRRKGKRKEKRKKKRKKEQILSLANQMGESTSAQLDGYALR